MSGGEGMCRGAVEDQVERGVVEATEGELLLENYCQVSTKREQEKQCQESVRTKKE